MEDFLEFTNYQFYGNTIGAWLLVFLYITLAVLAGKIVYWLTRKVLKRMATKTKTKADYIILDMIEEPVAFAVVIAGVWYGLHFGLSMSQRWGELVEKAYDILIIFNVAWMLSRLVDALIKEYAIPFVEKTESDLDDQLLPIGRKGIKFSLWILAIIVVLDNAGYDVAALVAGLGIGGLAFALAAQDTIANLFGGFTIFLDKPFKINDRVQVDGYDGTVTEIGIRSTRLKTLDGRILTIPNKSIAHNPTVNVTSEPTRKVVMNLGLTYDMDDQQMQLGMDTLKAIAAEMEASVENPLVAFNAFGDFSLNILFIYFIKKEADILNTMTAMNMAILKRFNEQELDFAFPSQTIYTKQG